MAETNGVPRWVDERFSRLDREIETLDAKYDGRLAHLEGKVDNVSEKLQSTRENLSNLLGRFALISAGIGAAVAALFTLIIHFITK